MNRIWRITAAALITGALITPLASPASAHEGPGEDLAGRLVERVDVTTIGDGAVVGDAKLVRTVDGVRGVVRTEGLERGHAYTVWSVVFNNPGACDGPCDGADLSNPEVGGSSLLLDGKVTKERARFSGAVDGVTDVFGAEVHLVVRTHGPAIPGLVDEQISTLNGGCPPNTCANTQAAIFDLDPGATSGKVVEREDVTTIGEGAVVGHTKLVRRSHGLHAVVRTEGLERGHAYTVWSVVFNNPAACDGPCDGADLSNPEVGGSSLLLDGKVTKERARFSGAVDGVTDVFGAEVHLVVRTHGPAIPGLVDEQTSTLNGGCPPNTCANTQVAIHAG